jgi:broad-specificity NMP kinase
MIIIINGSLGVGKSSIAEEIQWKFDKSVSLDGDHIGNVHPFEIYDDARIDHLYQTFANLISFHQTFGYRNFVINYVFESAKSLQSLIDQLHPLDSTIHTYWLTCDKNEQARRIRERQRDNLDWELNRFAELQQIQRQAAQEGFIGIEIDTTQLNLAEVSAKIWMDIKS